MGDAARRATWNPMEGPTGYDDGSMTFHYTAIGTKPSQIESEEEFVTQWSKYGEGRECVRQMLLLWYSKFRRGMGGWESEVAGDPDAMDSRLNAKTTMFEEPVVAK